MVLFINTIFSELLPVSQEQEPVPQEQEPVPVQALPVPQEPSALQPFCSRLQR